MLRLGWFSTARGPTSRKLLAAAHDEIAAGRLQAEIGIVFCNREAREDPQTDLFLEQVRGYGLPLVCFSYTRYRRERSLPPVRKGEPIPEWRRDYDRRVIRLLEPYPFDLGVLAGYMLIGSDVMCERYDMLNLHPAAPGGPAGIWQDVIWQLIEARAERSGVMMHLAIPEVDAGPPVTYCLYPIRGPAFDHLWNEIEGRNLAEIVAAEGEENALFKEIRRHGVARELPLVVATLRAFADGRVRIADGQVVDSQGRAIEGYDLSEEVEQVVASTLD
ncbi:MAG: phosphoglycerate transporter [Chloroflexi bacterium]|nr:phosphoglycerate transporter [Chloroflexota bacterium]